MSDDQSSCTGSAAFEAQSSRSLRDFIRTESGSAGMLVVAALVALVWANSPWSQSYVDLWHTEVSLRFGDGGLSMDLHHWINDGLMVVFFFVIGLEVRKEFAIGELTDRSRAVVYRRQGEEMAKGAVDLDFPIYPGDTVVVSERWF